MKFFPKASLALALPAAVLAGCAATSVPQDKLAQRTATAIGRDVGSFTIANQQMEDGGRLNYTVTAQDGAAYQCYIYEAPGVLKVTSLGMAPTTSDAICTPRATGRSAGVAARQAPANPNCNALLKAAGKC